MGMMSEEYMEKVGKYWGNHIAKQEREFWWDSEKLVSHMNYLICKEEIKGWNAGAIKCLRNIADKYPLALSVGCGNATKEMQLLESGLVEHFVCFELSAERIEAGRKIAKSKMLENRITFIRGDFLTSDRKEGGYDLVFWDNSLHHMLDAYEAVRVSYEILKAGGVFFCNDYIGESRFQWSDEKLEYVNAIRDTLDEEIFLVKGEKFPRHRKRPSKEKLMQSDPSEAADSDRILPAVKKYFPKAQITMLGGVVHLLLMDKMMGNIPEDSKLLKQLIEADDEAISRGMSNYAFILATKE